MTLPNLPTVNWSFPTQVRFGPGRFGELADAARTANSLRPLVVSDPGVAGQGWFGDGLKRLRRAKLEPGLFTEVKGNPTHANLEAGIRAYRDGHHDGVIAIGGGSALDLGKLVAFQQGQRLDVWEFEDVGQNWAKANADSIAPIIAVPTTAGTGSEVGRAGVLTDERHKVKKVIFHPLMLPMVAICDPELTVGLPPKLTAATGMDALAHCLEAYCAPGWHPMADGIAVEGFRLALDALPKAYADGSDLNARGAMMAAALMGAVAFQKGLGGIHALSHPIGAIYDTHHGLTNAVLMPYVMAYNRPAVEERLARLAAYCGVEGGFDGLLDRILSLREQLAVPHDIAGLLGGAPMTDAKAERVIADAPHDPTASGNPLKLDQAAARAILDAAREGTLRVR